MAGEIYLELRFKSGLILSGMVDKDDPLYMLRNNNAPGAKLAANTPLHGSHFAVLLQDQVIEKWVLGPQSAKSAAFHDDSA